MSRAAVHMDWRGLRRSPPLAAALRSVEVARRPNGVRLNAILKLSWMARSLCLVLTQSVKQHVACRRCPSTSSVVSPRPSMLHAAADARVGFVILRRWHPLSAASTLAAALAVPKAPGTDDPFDAARRAG